MSSARSPWPPRLRTVSRYERPGKRYDCTAQPFIILTLPDTPSPQSGNLFSTGFLLRHSSFYQKVKEIIDSGTLGRIISVEANETLQPAHGGYIMRFARHGVVVPSRLRFTRSSCRNWRRYRDQTGPHILEKCCHDIDILNWLLGNSLQPHRGATHVSYVRLCQAHCHPAWPRSADWTYSFLRTNRCAQGHRCSRER